MLKTLNVKDLQPGMMVTRVIAQYGPVKIRKVGMIRSPEMIKGLTEMGVAELEVDLAQSLGIDADSAGLGASAEIGLTPTQQLMQKDKLVSTADRDLSQQFHRSMFMPSPESLPSKWQLYGKNSAIMLLLLVGGGCFGWNLAQLPTWFALASATTPAQIPSLALNGKTNIQKHNNPVVPQTDIAKDKQDEQTPTQVQQATQEPPIVLGYQPESRANIQADIQARLNQGTPETQIDRPAEAVSPELMAKFNAAIAEMDARSRGNQSDRETAYSASESYDDVPRVDQLSVATLTDMPAMSFSAHMYASDTANRWVRVNGLRLVEGDFIANDLQIVNIEPQRVILSFRNEVFSMNALTDW